MADELQSAANQISIAQTALQAAKDALLTYTPPPPPPVVVAAPAPPPPIITPPPPTPLPPRGIARVQAWLGSKTVGVYCGIEFVNDRAAQYDAQVAQPLAAMGADYAIVKCADGATEWYDGTVAAIRSVFFKRGIGFAPYMWCVPGNQNATIRIAIHLAQVCGGVIFDMEDAWAGQDVEMAAILNAVRAAVPTACLIVTGYGDPLTKFGPTGFPFHTIATSKIDAYQPQWYIGVWDVYTQSGYEAAIDWGDKQCGAAFGPNFPLQPAIGLTKLRSADIAPLAAYVARWGTSVAVWEFEAATREIVQTLKAAVG